MDPISYGVAAKQKQRIEKVIAEPDSTSGVITVPQVIATGETITVPAGRTAVLPNVQVDGELVVDGEVFIPSGGSVSTTEVDATIVKQNGSVVVDTVQNQTIAGVKTFSSFPITPSSAPTADYEVANKKYVDSILPVGTILSAYTIFSNCLVAFGGEFNRIDYPKLWEYIQSNASLLKTEAQWQTELTTNGGICGFFSSGNGTTTFRVPNLDKAFLRPDSRGIASYQGDAIRNITGSVTQRVMGITSGSGAISVTNTASSLYGGGGGTGGILSFDASLQVPTASENRTKNIAILPLIVAK